MVWIAQYGAIGLFASLVLGILGLPVPDEFLLTYTGYLAFTGHIELWSAMLAALAGSVCGITLSYSLGRAVGSHKLERIGARFGLTPAKLERVRAWFHRTGKWTLVFGYFVPGFRHFTALVAGASRLPLREFAPFAYTGALLWSQIFIVLGYRLGSSWERTSERVHRAALVAAAVVLTGLALAAVVRRFRTRR
jgi:membrane protein DedA with SNARE-associated domain